MINCKQCGTENLDTSKFCLKCGAVLDGTAPAQPAFDASQPNPGFVSQPYNGQPAQPYAGVVQQPQFKMGWFKFIIYFQLFLNCVLNVFNAFSYISGTTYGEYRDLYYSLVPGLQAITIIFGVIYLALAAYSIFTRQMLVKFKKNAPLFLYICNGANFIITIIYLIVASILFGELLFSANLVGSVIGVVALLVINIIYFQKRKSLFVN